MHRDKTPSIRVPVAAIVSRDGFLVDGFEEKHKQRCENEDALDPNPHLIDHILAHHITVARTRLDPGPAEHLGGISAIRTGSVGCV